MEFDVLRYLKKIKRFRSEILEAFKEGSSRTYLLTWLRSNHFRASIHVYSSNFQ